MVPLPIANDFDTLNAKLLDGCIKRQQAKLRGQTETIAERMKRDTAAFMALPAVAFDACHKISTRVSSLSLVRYRTNDYSVPTQYGHWEVLVKGYADHVDICLGADIIARHMRSYGREEFIYNPLHYLALLEQKPRALDQAAPLQNWMLPEVFDRLRRLLEARMKRRGRKEYIQILRLLENFSMTQVEHAIKQAMGLGAVGFDAIKHLILCAIEQRPVKLDLMLYPYLPNASVDSTEPRSYLSLLQIPKANQQPAFGGSL